MDNRLTKSPTASRLDPLEKDLYLRLKPLRSKLEHQTLVVALSGGVDSVVLTRALVALQSRLGFKVHAVHVNHGVRGGDSDRDARFVADLCKELEIGLSTKKLRGLKKTASENLMRQKRYEFLFSVLKKCGGGFIVTAHHRDDLLETRLMRLLQGTGVHGLRSMGILSEEKILRPFLVITRREIEAFAKRHKMAWRHDASNDDTTKFRNWIRRNWLGLLRAEYPQYVDNLFNSLQRIVEDQDLVQNIQPSGAERLPRKNVAQLPDGELYHFLRSQAYGRVTSRHVAEFRKRLKTQRKIFEFRLAETDWNVGPEWVLKARD